jgi:Na+/phosphate symporter
MMVLMAGKPIESASNQIRFAIILILALSFVSIAHKLKSKWHWKGLNILSVPGLLLNLILSYAFFTFSAHLVNLGQRNPDLSEINIDALIKNSIEIITSALSMPNSTPWFLAGFGIVFFNSLYCLNLVTLQDEIDNTSDI